MMEQARGFLACAMELAYANLEGGGRPFGAVLVKDGKVIAKAANEIVQSHDPTAHAEMLAIRRASQTLGSANLEGCIMYASGQPCPMCMGAMRLAGIRQVFFAYSNEDGEPFGLSTAAIQADLARPFAEQSMMIRHEPVRLAGRENMYADWQRQQHIGH